MCDIRTTTYYWLDKYKRIKSIKVYKYENKIRFFRPQNISSYAEQFIIPLISERILQLSCIHVNSIPFTAIRIIYSS